MDQYVVLRFGWLYGPGTWYGKDGMIYNQFKDGEVTLSDGVTSFIHLDDAVEVSIQAMNFDTGIYNVADDEPVKGSDFAKDGIQKKLVWILKSLSNPHNHLNVALQMTSLKNKVVH